MRRDSESSICAPTVQIARQAAGPYVLGRPGLVSVSRLLSSTIRLFPVSH